MAEPVPSVALGWSTRRGSVRIRVLGSLSPLRLSLSLSRTLNPRGGSSSSSSPSCSVLIHGDDRGDIGGGSRVRGGSIHLRTCLGRRRSRGCGTSSDNALYGSQNCMLSGRWLDLVSLMLTSADLIVSRVSEKDLECIFTVICNLVTRASSPDEALEMAKQISAKVIQQPDDKPALRLKIGPIQQVHCVPESA